MNGEAAPAHRTYRHDIDGLRAVAIALVAAYHVWGHGRVSGGVDVFLMVSGFFVGGALLRRVSAGTGPRLRAYLPRLARRLLPALVITLAGVVIGTYFLLPRTEWTDVSAGVLASLTYWQNWHLAITGQMYGAADPDISPVQHIWSLSVQGQVFLLMPLLLLAAGWLLRSFRCEERTRSRVLVWLVVLLAAGSFGYACWRVSVAQDAAYYDTFARLWEYLAGTLVAVALARWSTPRVLAVPAGLLGLGLLLATGPLIDGRGTFPGVTALVPIAGAALVILAGQHGMRGINRVLAWRPVAVSGTYAYEFYLWHWVVLVLALAALDVDRLGRWTGLAVLVGSAVLAWGTHAVTARLREPATPEAPADPAVPAASTGDAGDAAGFSPDLPRHATRLRGGTAASPRRARVAAAGLVVVAVLVATAAPGAWLVERSRALAAADDFLVGDDHPGAYALLDPVRWPAPSDIDPVPSVLDAAADWPLAGREGCDSAGPRDATVHVCELGDPAGAVTVAMVGGSHSVSFAEPLDVVAAEQGVRVVGYFKQGCPLAVFEVAPTDVEGRSCAVWSQRVIETIIETGVVGVVTTGTRPGDELDEWGEGDYVPETYAAAWEELLSHGIGVAAIRDNPWLPFDGPTCIEVHGATSTACRVAREVALGTNPLLEFADHPGFSVIDLSDGMCDDSDCFTVVGNVVVYIDSNHLTATFARTLGSALADALDEVPWWP